MKFSNTLFAIALIFGLAKSNSINFSKRTDDYVQEVLGEVNSIEYIKYKGFNYRFYCLEDYNNKCTDIKNNLNAALDIISNTLEIYEPIIFDAFVIDYNGSTIAFNSDTNYIALQHPQI